VLLLPAYGVFFAGSLFAGSLAAPEVEPLPDDWSVDEPELEDDGEDGAGVAGVDGVVLLLGLELEGEDGEDGDMPPDALPLPEVLPPPAPRSQAAIRLAPNARETATAKVESFMLPP
jgi:hypothetical protein